MEENSQNISADLTAGVGNQQKFALYLLELYIQNSSSAVQGSVAFLDFNFPCTFSCYIAFRTSAVNNYAILEMVAK